MGRQFHENVERSEHRQFVRKFFLVAGALVLLLLISTYGWRALNSAKWVGYHEVDVQVVVLDASELTPIPHAIVEVLEGPRSPLETERHSLDEFKISEHGKLITSQQGRTDFSHRFWAAGSSGMFEKTGYVDTGNVWIRVTAEGYRTTYIPLDRQSIRVRDIKDDSPIFVTVPIGKF